MEDVLQGFISSKVLEADLLGRADRTKGKFRTFLVTALDRYVISQRRYEHADKRGAQITEQLGEAEPHPGAGGRAATADSFEVAWARQILREATARMRTQCDTDGRPDVWGVFESRILLPALQGTEPPDYSQIVERFAYRAPTQMWNAVRTGKQIFARQLRAVVAEYADSDEQVEAELRDLREICARLPQDGATAAYPSKTEGSRE
jgi:RNA polymerase sigma-70 factor (ECF subfamily)